MTTIIQERWEQIQKLSLKHGSHAPDSTFCVMEAVAYVAGEPWSDHPQCVPPTLGLLFRQWNDYLPTDKDRDRLLKAFIPRIVGLPQDDETELRRAYLWIDWDFRIALPMIFREAELSDEAEKLDRLPEIKKQADIKDLLARLARLARPALLDLLALKLNESKSALVERMISIVPGETL